MSSTSSSSQSSLRRALLVLFVALPVATCWVVTVTPTQNIHSLATHRQRTRAVHILSSTSTPSPPPTTTDIDYETPDDAVVNIKPNAMKRLVELRGQQKIPDGEALVLRMGVRSGGCSGMSYVMDFATSDDIADDDAVDDYEKLGVQCVVDAKSMLYLYGLELDFSHELIGGGFQFNNPNAEESCGCGSSFGV